MEERAAPIDGIDPANPAQSLTLTNPTNPDLSRDLGQQQNQPKIGYAVMFESDELKRQASEEFVRNHQQATIWENQKAEILVSAVIIIVIIVILVFTIRKYKKYTCRDSGGAGDLSRPRYQYGSGTSSDNANSQTTSNINSSSNIDIHDGRGEKGCVRSPMRHQAISIHHDSPTNKF